MDVCRKSDKPSLGILTDANSSNSSEVRETNGLQQMDQLEYCNRDDAAFSIFAPGDWRL
jgi:hypothetical protein